VAGGDRDPLAPEGLDRAFGWLERNLDELTEAARRQGEEIRQTTSWTPPKLESQATAVAPDRASANRKAIFLMRRPGEVACGRPAPPTRTLGRERFP